MRPEEAAWVREHAWTPQMRAQPVWLPGTSTATYDKAKALAQCDCQVGLCFHCATDRHSACHRKRFGRPHPEDYLADVPVWYADRTCRSLCPCPCPRTMSPREAAWVRDNVWTKAMRREYRDVVACACQYGPSTGCLQGKCRSCRPADPIAIWETTICDRTGIYPTRLPQEYEHDTVSATGPHRERLAMVWLADRICRWRCPHECHQAAEPARYELVPLPGLEAVGR